MPIHSESSIVPASLRLYYVRNNAEIGCSLYRDFGFGLSAVGSNDHGEIHPRVVNTRRSSVPIRSSYDSLILTESIRCVTSGGTPAADPSALIVSTTFIPVVTFPKRA
jgi:hypothetical protein